MIELSLKQFVPSEVCLKCDGCCRYKEADSAWRPKLGQDEQAGLAALITAGDILDSQGYIKAIQASSPHAGHSRELERHFCRFLNQGDNTCGIYTKRPFECSLYPFILSKAHDAVKVYAHLACPFVQDHLPRADFDAYAAYLKEFFRRAETKGFLSRNKAMFHDYSPYTSELLHLFDLLFL
jgi:uncharacterized protein